MKHRLKRLLLPLGFMTALLAPALAQDTVDPTYLVRTLSSAAMGKGVFSSPSAHYRPLFGEGDKYNKILKEVSRYGELSIDANGKSAAVRTPGEEHLLVILSGDGSIAYNGQDVPVRAGDFAYIAPGATFGLNAQSSVRAMVMGFKIRREAKPAAPAKKLPLANWNGVPLVEVASHPRTTLYRLMVGDTTSKRDKLATAYTAVSLFMMEIQPGGTNIPHHHELQEEIYLLLEGDGTIVAGSGLDGVMGKFPVKAGASYYYRPNTTVGFYNTGGKLARILAVRSTALPN